MRWFRVYFVRGLAVAALIFVTTLTGYFYSFFFFSDQHRKPISEVALEKVYVYYSSPLTKGKVALTYDDGPTSETLQIASELKKANAPGTFFFVGSAALMNPDVVKKIHDQGFEIGNHTFTHQTSVHASKRRLAQELATTEYILSTITGEHTRFYRPPFLMELGKDITLNPYVVMPEGAAWIAQLGYIPAGADVDSRDWATASTDDVIRNVLANMGKQGGVILLHDRKPTSLETTRIVNEVRARGYEIVPLADLLTPPTTHVFSRDIARGASGNEVNYLQWFLFDKGYLDPWSLTGVYDSDTENAVARFEAVSNPNGPITGIFAGAVRESFNKQIAIPTTYYPEVKKYTPTAVRSFERGFFDSFGMLTLFISAATYFSAILVFIKLAFMIILHLVRMVSRKHATTNAITAASVIVPAYNEELGIESTIRSLDNQKNIHLEIIVVDDGSKDKTAAVVKDLLKEQFKSKIIFIQSENRGKPHALNLGLARASQEIVVTVDADTILSDNAVAALVGAFSDKNVGAAAGKVYTTHTKSFLEYMQNIEYLVGQNVDKRAFELVNAIHVVPGPIGAWRKSALIEVGGFKEGTLVEDQDTTLALLEEGYSIRYVPTALAYAETPGTWRDFIRQRYRWTYGTLQCFAKYAHTIITRPFSGLGFVVIPMMLLYGLITPLTYVIVDGALLIGIASGSWNTIVLPVLLFMVFDTVYAGIGMIGEKKWLQHTLMVPVVRFVSRYIAFSVVIQSCAAALEGAVVGWNKVDRTGGVHNLFVAMTSKSSPATTK